MIISASGGSKHIQKVATTCWDSHKPQTDKTRKYSHVATESVQVIVGLFTFNYAVVL